MRLGDLKGVQKLDSLTPSASASNAEKKKLKIFASYKMIRVFENQQLNLQMHTAVVDKTLYFKAKEVALALGYEKPPRCL